MKSATNIRELRILAASGVKYADALLAVFDAVGAHDVGSGGEKHAIYVGPSRSKSCPF